MPCAAKLLLACLVSCMMAALLPAYDGEDMYIRLKAAMLLVTTTWLCMLGTLLCGGDWCSEPSLSAFIPGVQQLQKCRHGEEGASHVDVVRLCEVLHGVLGEELLAKPSWTEDAGFQPFLLPTMPEFATSKLTKPVSAAIWSTAAWSESLEVTSHWIGTRPSNT